MDLRNLGYIYFQEKDIKKAASSNRSLDNKFACSYLLGGLNFVLKFIYSLLFFRRKFKPYKEQVNVLVYGPSVNNRNTLMPIVERLGNKGIAAFLDQKSLPLWKLYWYALPHIGELITEILKSSQEERKLFKLFFPKFWRMYGCERFAEEFMVFYNPKVVVMANDHLELNRAILNACKERNIKTLYAQHATVGYDFPPLAFTYSFLDGLDALRKYEDIGNIAGNVYLSGGVRFDRIPRQHNSAINNSVGVAINLVDDTEKIKDVIIGLKGSFPGKNIILRPHPQMPVVNWRTWCDSNDIDFSSSHNETSFEFINRTDLVISNQCSIHLDSALCHKPSVVYNLSNNQPDDVYGFVKNGLVKQMEDMYALVEFIKNLSNYVINEDAVKYYNYAYSTKHEGRVADIIVDLIESIINCETESFNHRNGFKELYTKDNCKVYRYE